MKEGGRSVTNGGRDGGRGPEGWHREEDTSLQPCAAGFGDGAGAVGPGTWVVSTTFLRKAKKTDAPLECPEEMQPRPCQHLDFSPGIHFSLLNARTVRH